MKKLNSAQKIMKQKIVRPKNGTSIKTPLKSAVAFLRKHKQTNNGKNYEVK